MSIGDKHDPSLPPRPEDNSPCYQISTTQGRLNLLRAVTVFKTAPALSKWKSSPAEIKKLVEQISHNKHFTNAQQKAISLLPQAKLLSATALMNYMGVVYKLNQLEIAQMAVALASTSLTSTDLKYPTHQTYEKVLNYPFGAQRSAFQEIQTHFDQNSKQKFLLLLKILANYPKLSHQPPDKVRDLLELSTISDHNTLHKLSTEELHELKELLEDSRLTYEEKQSVLEEAQALDLVKGLSIAKDLYPEQELVDERVDAMIYYATSKDGNLLENYLENPLENWTQLDRSDEASQTLQEIHERALESIETRLPQSVEAFLEHHPEASNLPAKKVIKSINNVRRLLPGEKEHIDELILYLLRRPNKRNRNFRKNISHLEDEEENLLDIEILALAFNERGAKAVQPKTQKPILLKWKQNSSGKYTTLQVVGAVLHHIELEIAMTKQEVLENRELLEQIHQELIDKCTCK